MKIIFWHVLFIFSAALESFDIGSEEVLVVGVFVVIVIVVINGVVVGGGISSLM